MQGYSQDLRERVIHGWQAGKTQSWLEQTYEISISTVKRYIAQYRTDGHVRAKQQKYKQPTIRDEQLGELVQQLQAHADATIDHHVQWWQERTGQTVNHSMMWRAIDRAGWTRKKRQWVPKSVMS